MPREFKRTDRVGHAIAKELSNLISREVRDPRISPVSISLVKVSRDFAHAKIFFTVLMPEQITDATLALDQASGFLRTKLASKLSLRTMPKLHFIYDDTLDRARHMDKLIDGLFTNDSSEDSSN